MSVIQMDDDDEALGNLDSKAEQPKRVVVDDSEENLDAQLTQAWVRTKLGQNRGEERFYHGPRASFDALLDQRLASSTRKDKTPARGVVGG